MIVNLKKIVMASYSKKKTIFGGNSDKEGNSIADVRYERGVELNKPKNINMYKYAEGGYVKANGIKTNDGKKGGFFEGRSHAEGGIKAINVDTNTPLEVESNEVVINKKSVLDKTLHNFNGKKMTNREILSHINQAGGGVAFENGGETDCGCSHDKYEDGGEMKDKYLHLSSDVYEKGGKISHEELNETEKHILSKLGYKTTNKCEISNSKLNDIKDIEKKGVVYTTPSKHSKNCHEVRLTDYGFEQIYGQVFDYDINKFAKGGEMDCGCSHSFEHGGYMLDGGETNDILTEEKYFKGIDFKYKNQFEINKAIEELIESKNVEELSPSERQFVSYYAGYGGLSKFGATGKGLLYEFFTPSEIAKKMWGLAYKHGFKGGKVLEPSVGIGEFLKYAPDEELVTAYETNKISARICQILFPKARIENKYFEQLFIKNNNTIKNEIKSLPKFSLIIGNPPYGSMGGIYAGMGEKSYTKANNYIEYFIFRGLDLLESGGLLIYIIGTEVALGGTPFLQQPINLVKKMISEKAYLIDAYRLPNGLFETTDVLTDIIVLKKK